MSASASTSHTCGPHISALFSRVHTRLVDRAEAHRLHAARHRVGAAIPRARLALRPPQALALRPAQPAIQAQEVEEG